MLSAAGGRAVVAADEPLPFRYYKEVQFEPLDAENIVVVPLDSEVYAATDDRFSSVRLIDGSGREVPFLLRKATETRTETIRNHWRTEDFALHPLEDGGLEILIRLKEDAPQPDGIRIVTPLKNFEQRVRVFGSAESGTESPPPKPSPIQEEGADGENWQPVVPQAVIFDYSRYMDVRQPDVPLPENTYRQFRIVIDDVTVEQQSQLLDLTRSLRGGKETERTERITIQRRPFRIDRIEFWEEIVRERVKGLKKTQYPVLEFHVDENPDEQQTVIEVRTRREPLTGFVLKTPDRNFSRRVTVQVPASRGIRMDWREVGEATLSRFDFRDLHREDLEVTFPEQRQERYRIVVHNRDSPPLDIADVRAEGAVYHLVYFAAPETAYRVYYGHPDDKTADRAEPPRYDTAALEATLEEGYEPVPASLGDQEPPPGGAKPPVWTPRRFLTNPLALGAAIFLLVAVLAWALYRATRRIENLPNE